MMRAKIFIFELNQYYQKPKLYICVMLPYCTVIGCYCTGADLQSYPLIGADLQSSDWQRAYAGL